MNFLSLPYTSDSRDYYAGRTESGRPLKRTMAGHTYSEGYQPDEETQARLQAVEDADRAIAGGGFPAPKNRQKDIGNPFALLWDEVADMVSTPRRAYQGEPLTYGDVGEFALEYGVMGSPMPAPKGALRSGAARSAAKTPAQAQAQEILDLLKQGRADEVTDDMMAAADDLYLYENYDLPMDEASRIARAQEMGFDEDALHGTVSGRDFQGFKGLDRRGNPQETYFAPDTEDGRAFVQGFSSADQGRVFPVKLKTSDVLDTRKADDFAEFERTLDREDRLVHFNMRGGMKESGLPGWGDQSVIDAIGGSGRDGMRIHERDWLESTAMHNPNAVRSRFARFDPRLSHLRNLSAGAAGGGVVLSEDERKQEIRNYLRSK